MFDLDAHTLLQWLTLHGPLLLFALLVLGIVGLPVPDETLLMAAGYLVCAGRLSAAQVAIAALLGSWCGISISYGIGRGLRRALAHRPRRHLPVLGERLQEAERWYKRHGRWALVFGYYVPGFRHFVAVIAGLSRLPLGLFVRFAYSGGVLWVSTFLVLGYTGGAGWMHLPSKIQHCVAEGLLVAGILALLGYGLRFWRRRAQS